ncbi:MAG: ribonuclease III domain-containing protein [Bacilli bacterium]|nr:ribonuclease III domain-containing protein [Bacilli bacterium]
MPYNSLVLAYMGDAIYEVYIRNYLIEKKILNVHDLQKEAIKYVSAKGQESYLKKMMEENFLSEEELAVVQRGRNHKGTRHPKNTDIITYKYSTGFEALIGDLYFKQNKNRIDEIMQFIIGE